jgi:hypothetical protein
MTSQLFSKFSPTIVDLLELSFSQSLQCFLNLFKGKERRDLDLSFDQSISPLSEGIIGI